MRISHLQFDAAGLSGDSAMVDASCGGALILTRTQEQLKALPALAHANSVKAIQTLSREDIVLREPHLSRDVLGGFLVPGETIVARGPTARSILEHTLLNGARLRRNADAPSNAFGEICRRLETTLGPVRARLTISCASLDADIADTRLLGAAVFTIRLRKGQFVVFDKLGS